MVCRIARDWSWQELCCCVAALLRCCHQFSTCSPFDVDAALAATCVVLVELRVALSPTSLRGTRPSARRRAAPPRGRTRLVAARLARARTQSPVNPRRGLVPGRGTLHPLQRPFVGAGGTGERVCTVPHAGYKCMSLFKCNRTCPNAFLSDKRLHGNQRRACSRGSVVFN